LKCLFIIRNEPPATWSVGAFIFQCLFKVLSRSLCISPRCLSMNVIAMLLIINIWNSERDIWNGQQIREILNWCLEFQANEMLKPNLNETDKQQYRIVYEPSQEVIYLDSINISGKAWLFDSHVFPFPPAWQDILSFGKKMEYFLHKEISSEKEGVTSGNISICLKLIKFITDKQCSPNAYSLWLGSVLIASLIFEGVFSLPVNKEDIYMTLICNDYHHLYRDADSRNRPYPMESIIVAPEYFCIPPGWHQGENFLLFLIDDKSDTP